MQSIIYSLIYWRTFYIKKSLKKETSLRQIKYITMIHATSPVVATSVIPNEENVLPVAQIVGTVSTVSAQPMGIVQGANQQVVLNANQQVVFNPNQQVVDIQTGHQEVVYVDAERTVQCLSCCLATLFLIGVAICFPMRQSTAPCSRDESRHRF